MTDEDVDAGLGDLLTFLREQRGVDFTGYKRPSLARRVRRRMEMVDVADLDAYQDLLEAEPDEQSRLVETVLINVTKFFRDDGAWRFLADEIVSKLIDAKGAGEPIRVWSAGCASGEEAYTIAMILAETLGIDEFRRRVKIYATDVDDDALGVGRRGSYTTRQLEPVPDELIARYFEPGDDERTFRSDCRRSVIFGRHDITTDAPISRLDLLICRNVLMYLVRETQRGVLSRFHYALGGGYLFLGRAETVFSHPDLFIPVSVPLRIFAGVPDSPRRDELVVHDGERPGPVEPDSAPLAALAMASTPVAQLVVDVDGRLSSANTKARALFGITRDNLGQRFRDLEVSYRPVELRPLIERAFAESTPVRLHDVPRSLAGGQTQYLEVAVAPLRDAAGVDLGASVTFTDVTELGRARRDLDRSTGELRVAVAQLQSANEELETTNEELQSANEELETTNEELQSANEELETMNEELQSANEELDAMNREFLRQSVEIEAAEQLLDGVLDGLSVGAAVLDDSLDVRLWNRTMEQLWGVERDDARDRSILALDIGFPVREIADSLHTIAGTGGDEAREFRLDGIDAVDHRGRALSCRVAIRRVREPDEGEGRIAVLIDVRPVSVP